VLYAWNEPETILLPADCVHELFRQQVVKTEESPAVVDGQRTVSYRELDTASNRLAHHLVKTGVRQGSIVGIYMPRSWEMLAAMLGVLKAGGGCLSLDPLLPAERLARVLLDSNPACVVTKDGMLPRPEDVRVVDLDGQRE
jgi:non-ribosomal peptide synthetase component F